jgi:SAM-dependent methyltransferase
MTKTESENPSQLSGNPAGEPLELLARFSWEWAPLLCDSEHGCRDYHRCWSMVRLLNKGGALPAGFEFFRRQFAGLVDEGRSRVLISGAADTGLMALVCAVFDALNAKPDIVLVDRCRTTVTQNQILANYLGLQADVRQGDVRDIDCEPVDAVIAHSFLVFFPEPDRRQVINAWGRVLKPGGKVLMSANIARHEKVKNPPKDQAKILAGQASLVSVARENGFSESDTQALGDIAVAMWRKQNTHEPQLTEEFLDDAFRQAGLRLCEVTLKEKERLGPLAAFRPPTDLIQRGEVVGIRE